MKMPGLARRLRVALDWTMDLLFPKDIVQLGLSEAPRAAPDYAVQRIGLEETGQGRLRDTEAARNGA